VAGCLAVCLTTSAAADPQPLSALLPAETAGVSLTVGDLRVHAMVHAGGREAARRAQGRPSDVDLLERRPHARRGRDGGPRSDLRRAADRRAAGTLHLDLCLDLRQPPPWPLPRPWPQHVAHVW